LIVGTSRDPDQFTGETYSGEYHEVVDVFEAGSINNQTDADTRAAVILTRIKAELLSGKLVLPFHDCRTELYDNVRIYDTRGI